MPPVAPGGSRHAPVTHPWKDAGRVWALTWALTCLTPQRAVLSQDRSAPASGIRLDTATRLIPVNARPLWVEHRGRRALTLAPLAGQENATDQELSAIIVGSEFRDGVIEVDVSGARRRGYATDDASAFKGFVGISFRVRGDTAERFYLRPENARLPSQLFRNRSTQYEASPDFPWQRLRRESPGLYESYADMQAGDWTHLRIEVKGTAARLYINGATQPALVVSDLKNGTAGGAIALWSRISSEAFFSNLRVSEGEVAPPVDRAAPRPAAIGPLPQVRSVVNGRATVTTYQGRDAVHLVPSAEVADQDVDMLGLLDESITDGTIELEVAGQPRPGMPADSRGFVGLAFRAEENGAWADVMYLRPSNGRAADQLRRNHSVQYVSHPEFTWDRLRTEHPGVYESNVDLVSGEWTALRIVVSGDTARLHVNNSPQPVLIVNDLRRGRAGGRIALWAHVQTDAYFRALRVTPAGQSQTRPGHAIP